MNDKWTVSEKIESLLRALTESPRLRFSDLFAAATSRSEVVVTFLALLELIRLRQIVAVQKDPFGEIEIQRNATGPVGRLRSLLKGLRQDWGPRLLRSTRAILRPLLNPPS